MKTDGSTYRKPIVLILFLFFIFFAASCKAGKWKVDGKFDLQSDGGADVAFRLYPADKDAGKYVDRAVEELKKKYPAAKVTTFSNGNDRGIIIEKKVMPDDPEKNYSLRKEKNRWVFHYKNQFLDNVEIQKVEVNMPGVITSTNANKHYGKYARWERPFKERTFHAESAVTPFEFTILFWIMTGIIIAGGIAFLVIGIRKRKEAKEVEETKFDY